MFQGRLYTPLSAVGGPFVSVCASGSQNCQLRSWVANPAVATAGTTNIAHAPAPVVQS